jgi:hypothetical protein
VRARNSILKLIVFCTLVSGVSATSPASAAAMSTQSICLDGTQSISVNTTAIGTENFTAELWVKPSSTQAYETFFDMGLGSGFPYLGYDGQFDGKKIMFYWGGGVMRARVP